VSQRSQAPSRDGLKERKGNDMFGGSLITIEAIRGQRFPQTHKWERRVFASR
jgi:hypothetical protein